jgi:predicted MFS family arabinose efflux permease
MSSPWPAYVLVTITLLGTTLYRPAHTALMPSLCRTANELTSANVVRGSLDSLGTLSGPLLAGVLVGPIGVEGVFMVCALLALWSAWLIWRPDYEAPPRIVESAPPHRVHETIEGVAFIYRDRDVRLMTVLGTLQTVTRGCFSVFAVVVALQMLGLGAAGVGALTAAFGGGAVVGSVATSLLVGSSGLGQWLGVGVSGWGVPFIVLAAVSSEPPALVFAGVGGCGERDRRRGLLHPAAMAGTG